MSDPATGESGELSDGDKPVTIPALPDEVEIVDEVSSQQPAVVIPFASLAEFFLDSAKKTLPRKSKLFNNPFKVDEELLIKIDRRIRAMFSEVGARETILNIEVRYSDLSSETFGDLAECFEFAAEEADAESVFLSWSSLSASGGYQQIDIGLVTEKPLDNAYLKQPQHESAGIDLTVMGPARRWVKDCFSQLENILKTARLSPLYRPLEVFRNAVLNTAVSWIVGGACWYLSLEFLRNLVSESKNHERMKSILGPPGLDERFELFIQDYLSPKGFLLLDLLVFVLPYAILFATQMMCSKYLPYLVPRSTVSIGLSQKRYNDYMNVFRFVVFTVIVGSILGVAVNLISDAIK